MTPPTWMQNEFIRSHLEAIEGVARGIHYYLTLSNPEHTGDGLAQFTAVWNAFVEDESIHSSQRHKILTDTYRWLRGRADAQQRHRERLGKFLAHCLEREELRHSRAAQGSPEQSVKRLELALAGIGSAIERTMPDDVVREGEGQVHLTWQQPLDAQVHWDKTEETGLGLLMVAVRSFSVHGQFSSSEAHAFANCVVEEIAWDHRVGLPNFSYPDKMEKQFPSYLRWRRGKVQYAAEADLPEWIQQRQPATESLPSAIELSLHEFHPGLADGFDDLLREAAMENLKQGPDPETSESLVDRLVLALAYHAGRPAHEVAELCGERLQAIQPRASGPDECAANTAALAFLWSRLSAR